MAKPRTTLNMDIDLRGGGQLRLDLNADGTVRRLQTPAVSTLTAKELAVLQAVESQFFVIANLIDQLT